MQTLSSADLKTVPADIPLDIVRLDLSKNNIKQLRPKKFVTVKDLKLLNLSGNSLEGIHTGELALHNNTKTLIYPFFEERQKKMMF